MCYQLPVCTYCNVGVKWVWSWSRWTVIRKEPRQIRPQLIQPLVLMLQWLCLMANRKGSISIRGISSFTYLIYFSLWWATVWYFSTGSSWTDSFLSWSQLMHRECMWITRWIADALSTLFTSLCIWLFVIMILNLNTGLTSLVVSCFLVYAFDVANWDWWSVAWCVSLSTWPAVPHGARFSSCWRVLTIEGRLYLIKIQSLYSEGKWEEIPLKYGDIACIYCCFLPKDSFV